VTSLAHRGFVHLGMDVSKDSISVAILHPDRDVAAVEKISSDSESVRRLVKKVGRPSGIWACYEAGPTGYDLYRLLTSMKVRCDVVAPSLVPKGRGDRVKTDKRDSRRLAGLHRAGQLTPIAVPDPAQEAVRDLCRTRGDMVADLTRARNRLTKFLLRHSMIYRDGTNWTIRHQQWLSGLHFEDRALAATFAHYRSTVQLRDTALEAVEADLRPYFATDPFAQAVARLGCYRGVSHMGALCLGAEVFDWQRFPTARGFMGFTGLTCSENSTGLSERRGAITRAGNSHVRAQLIEAAWSYQHRPALGATIRARQDGAHPASVARSWAAQNRLSKRFTTLAARKNVKSVVAAAVARELAGFLWAEMTAHD
jgi:transposase